jgi:hypothetical protein
MPEHKMMEAIDRIKKALDRLEMIEFPNPAKTNESSDLQDRHELLKREAQAALADIDRLILQAKG